MCSVRQSSAALSFPTPRPVCALPDVIGVAARCTCSTAFISGCECEQTREEGRGKWAGVWVWAWVRAVRRFARRLIPPENSKCAKTWHESGREDVEMAAENIATAPPVG